MSYSSGSSPSLWLDHASIAVPDLSEAVRYLGTRLGLGATVSPEDPEHHSRVYLDRGYLEVSAREPVNAWIVRHFFLRFADPEGLRRHLDSAGIANGFDSYSGVDGIWDDVEVEVDSVPLPILVRRTHPPDVARDWPPGLSGAHACGARTLEAVCVAVPDLEAAIAAYARLLGLGPLPARAGEEIRQAEFPLAAGRIVLVEGEGEGAGPAGIVLGVSTLSDTESVVGPLTRTAVGWLSPEIARDLRLGFVEVAGPAGAGRLESPG